MLTKTKIKKNTEYTVFLHTVTINAEMTAIEERNTNRSETLRLDNGVNCAKTAAPRKMVDAF